MVPYARLTCSLLFGLLASRADGMAAARDGEVEAPSLSETQPASELRLDRSLTNLIVPGPFTAYAVEYELELEACSSFDKNRQLRGRLGSALINAASEQLNLPMGSGRFLDVQGKKYLFCLEPHYREPGSGHGPTGWHKGVTVYDASAS